MKATDKKMAAKTPKMAYGGKVKKMKMGGAAKDTSFGIGTTKKMTDGGYGKKKMK
jgi:hypothetical protein